MFACFLFDVRRAISFVQCYRIADVDAFVCVEIHRNTMSVGEFDDVRIRDVVYLHDVQRVVIHDIHRSRLVFLVRDASGNGCIGIARRHADGAQYHDDVPYCLCHASYVGSPMLNVLADACSACIFCNVNSGFCDNPARSMDSACEITGLLPLAVIQ